MGRVIERSKMLGRQIKNGDTKGAAADVRQWLWSEQEYVGLTRTLSQTFEPSPANVSLRAELMDESLAAKVFDFSNLGERDATYLGRRRRFYDAGFENGFVAVTPEGEPAFLQWLIPPSQNDKIKDFFGPIFPLDNETLIVEGAWIPPKFRKERVMGAGLSLVTEAAALASPEASKAMCFPERANSGAVKGSMAGGYEITTLRTTQWRVGRRSISFADTNAAQLGF